MAEYRDRKISKSAAWEHFEVKDAEKFTATCNLCQCTFSYRTSVSNLTKHLRTKHSFQLMKALDDDLTDAETDTEEKENQTDQRKILKSEVWEHFEVKDAVDKTATCNHCSEQFSYRTTSTNLSRHLKSKHGVELTKDEDITDNEEKVDTSIAYRSVSPHRGHSKSSSAWQYFEDIDPVRRLASCTICGAQCSYRTSVSNLMKHARRKHGVGEQDVSDAYDSQQQATKAGRSIVWSYFKCVDRETRVARCQICGKMISHASTLTNLKKHLARKHPNVNIPRKRILLSSGGELYEVETSSKQGSDDNQEDDDQIQNDTTEMDTVYLEDFDTLEQDPPKKRQKKLVSRIAYDTSSEDEVTFDTPKKKDVLDHFGKYIVSLLRQLPNQISNQLQSDFVKQIMNEMKRTEQADTSNAFNAPDKSDEYSVTVIGEDVVES